MSRVYAADNSRSGRQVMADPGHAYAGLELPELPRVHRATLNLPRTQLRTEKMSLNYSPGRTFGLLPEPERSPASFISSVAINGMILLLVLYISATAKRVIEEHKYEDTVLIVPTTPPPPEKVKLPEPPKIQPPEPPKLEIKYEAPKINMPKPEPKPDLKPIQMEAKVNMPVVKDARPSVILSPQPKAALTAAMPAQSKDVKPSTARFIWARRSALRPIPTPPGRPPSPRLEIRMAA